MNSTNPKPKWWQLYLTFPLLIAMFAGDAQLKLTLHEHEAVQIGIVLLIYGLIRFWIKSNARALTRSYTQSDHERVTVLQNPSYRISTTGEHPYQNSEIHGVLADTFEMDVIDAKFLPEEQASDHSRQD